ELKAILAHPDIRLDVDPAAVEDYLAFGLDPGPRSIFRQVEKLPPAHVWTAAEGQWQQPPRRNWELRFEPDEPPSAPHSPSVAQRGPERGGGASSAVAAPAPPPGGVPSPGAWAAVASRGAPRGRPALLRTPPRRAGGRKLSARPPRGGGGPGVPPPATPRRW